MARCETEKEIISTGLAILFLAVLSVGFGLLFADALDGEARFQDGVTNSYTTPEQRKAFVQ